MTCNNIHWIYYYQTGERTIKSSVLLNNISFALTIYNSTRANQFDQRNESVWLLVQERRSLTVQISSVRVRLLFSNHFACSFQLKSFDISGSIGYLGKLFGSLTCGYTAERFGRRNAMLLINIPHLIAFLLFYYSTSIWKVFVANTLLGFGSGFMKAPCTTYIAEIRWVCEIIVCCHLKYE